MVVEFVFAVAFSAVPLTLYLPPMRHLTLFVASIEELLRDTRGYRLRVFPRLLRAFRFLLPSPSSATAS